MNDRKKRELVAYAMDFCSFLLRSEIGTDVRRAVLFGSVARGDFDSESDVDIFIDTDGEKNVDASVKKVLKSFEMSETNDNWGLKGVKNPISIKVGKLEAWELYGSVISNGIILYGKFEEMPKEAKYYSMLALDFGKMDRNKKIRIWRELYGYRQKTGKKFFVSRGLLEELSGKKIERGVIAVPAHNKDLILEFAKKRGINYRIFEIWTNSF